MPIPEPSLDGAEAGLRQRIEATRSELARLRSSDTGGAELAAVYGRLGTLYLLTELRAPAEVALSNAARLDPSEPRWPYFLGLVRQDVGDLEGSLDSLRSALALRPDSVTVQLRLAESLRVAGQLDESRLLFERVLTGPAALDAGEGAFARYGLGLIAVAQRRFEAAIEYLEAVRTALPEATVVRRVLGLAYREVGRVEEARRELQAGGDTPVPLPDAWTAELRAVDTGAYLSKAVAARVRGDLAEAERLFRQAVAADPRSGDALRGLGDVLFLAGDRAGGVAALAEAVEAEPGRGDLRVQLGEFLVLSGRPADAVAPFRKAIELTPRAAEAHLGLGRALAMSGRHDEAVHAYRRCLELAPGHLEARALVARALGRMGRHAEAAAELAQALAIDPGDTRLRLAHVDALARAGDTVGVRDSLEAGVVSSGDPRLVATLIQVLLGDPDPHRRDPPRAVALGVDLLRAEPSVSNALLVARALYSAGRIAEAVDLQRRSVDEAQAGGAPDDELAAMRQTLELYRQRLKGGGMP